MSFSETLLKQFNYLGFIYNGFYQYKCINMLLCAIGRMYLSLYNKKKQIVHQKHLQVLESHEFEKMNSIIY